MVGTILKEGLNFKNTMKTKDHTHLALVLWQIMEPNILSHVGHLIEIENFGLYVLWNTFIHKLNLDLIFHNNLFRCQSRAYLPMLDSLLDSL